MPDECSKGEGIGWEWKGKTNYMQPQSSCGQHATVPVLCRDHMGEGASGVSA